MQSESIRERILTEDLAHVASLLIADHLSTKQAWIWSGVYILLAVLVPVLFLLWRIHRGRVK